MSSLFFIYFLERLFLFDFFSSFTRSAYLRVFRVCSELFWLGDMHPIMTVLQFPIKESLRTCVNLLPRNGVCLFD